MVDPATGAAEGERAAPSVWRSLARARQAGGEPGHKCLVLGRSACRLLLGEHGRELTGQERRHGQAQAREDAAVDDRPRVRRQWLVDPLAEREPFDRSVQHPPDQVLLYAVAPVDLQLGVAVDGSATGSDLDNQLRRPFDVAIVTGAGAAAGGGIDAEQGVWLGLVIQIRADGGVVRQPDAWSSSR